MKSLRIKEDQVSTRSRPKAAGRKMLWSVCRRVGFNTQPPEGGWLANRFYSNLNQMFQHAAARRRLVKGYRWLPKAFCFNTQPPEGGWRMDDGCMECRQSFNTQPPEGGWMPNTIPSSYLTPFQHAAARRRLAKNRYLQKLITLFQHAAARRRLVNSCKAL